jgi:hypothetical protein
MDPIQILAQEGDRDQERIPSSGKGAPIRDLRGEYQILAQEGDRDRDEVFRSVFQRAKRAIEVLVFQRAERAE